MNPSNTPHFLCFQFYDSAGNIREIQFRQPVMIFHTDQVDEVMEMLSQVQEKVRQGYYAAGYVSYEAAPAFDPAYKVSTISQIPLLWFGIYEQPVVEPIPTHDGDFTVSDWKPSTDPATYNQAILQVRDAIVRGDTYQTNYTIRLHADFVGDDFAYYQRLSDRQQAGYAAYLNIGRYRVLSASPELFFNKVDDTITTKPMKGTAKRGRTVQEDQKHIQFLVDSEKERAENVMIVDLLRNDLSRIAKRGTVQVPLLFSVETYPTVHQMTSTVTAEVETDISICDIFRALFPCGSITGAPKISTMHLIEQLEPEPREVYCGAIGFIEPNGDAIFNVAIRTVIIDTQTNTAQYGVGGAITWDSTASGEYDEVLTKAKVLTAEMTSFDLLESMKMENGDYYLLDRHLERMRLSAQYFGFPFPIEQIHQTLQSHALKYPKEVQKVRLLISKYGRVQLNYEKIEFANDEPKIITLAKLPVSRNNPFLYHKTTNRMVYEEHRMAAEPVFDVLLWNEEGELTEFTNGNLVMEIEGKYYTPPMESGLLAGTFRAQLIDDGVITERLLTLSDYETCQSIWLINSVRGWVRCEKV